MPKVNEENYRYLRTKNKSNLVSFTYASNEMLKGTERKQSKCEKVQ